MNNSRKILLVLVVGLSVVIGASGAYAYTVKLNTQKTQVIQTNPITECASVGAYELKDFNVIKEYELDQAVSQRIDSSTTPSTVMVAMANVEVKKTTNQKPVSRSIPSVAALPRTTVSSPTVETPEPATPVPAPTYDGKTAILGKSVASASQLEKLIHLRNPAAVNLAGIYIEMEKIYGIRADLAFLQMVKETNALKFTGDVSISQHNPAGIGATGGGAAGATFSSWEEGIEAQFQHLLAYASTKPIPSGRKLVDPRFDLVKRGSAPYVEWLGKADNPNGTGWAWPGDGYGASIINLLNEALKY